MVLLANDGKVGFAFNQLLLVLTHGGVLLGLGVDGELFDCLRKKVFWTDVLALASFNRFICQFVRLLAELVDEAECFLISERRAQ